MEFTRTPCFGPIANPGKAVINASGFVKGRKCFAEGAHMKLHSDGSLIRPCHRTVQKIINNNKKQNKIAAGHEPQQVSDLGNRFQAWATSGAPLERYARHRPGVDDASRAYVCGSRRSFGDAKVKRQVSRSQTRVKMRCGFFNDGVRRGASDRGSPDRFNGGGGETNFIHNSYHILCINILNYSIV